MGRPRLLDLFCGAGGSAVGYARAGFEVVGVDNAYQPRYPFRIEQIDALRLLEILLAGGGRYQQGQMLRLKDFAAIHASPPCQAYSQTRQLQGNNHPDLIAPTRGMLEDTGLPFVIENVKGAPLRRPVVLEGQMFDGLQSSRPRYFETNWPLEQPMMPPPPIHTKMGRKPKGGEFMHVVGHFTDAEAGREALGISWMTRDELAQAVPPAYCEWIGERLLHHITQDPFAEEAAPPNPPDQAQAKPAKRVSQSG